MTSAALLRKRIRAQRTRRLGVDSWVWIAVIAITPLQQLFYALVSPQVRIVPLLTAVVSLLLARVAMTRMQGALTVTAIFVVLGGLASGANSDVAESVSVAVTLALLIALAPAAILFQLRRYPTFLRTMLATVLTVQTISAGAGIVQLAGVPILGVVARDGRVNGLAYHPNVLGLMAALAILVMVDLFRRRVASRALLVVAITINAAALIATASLSSLLTLAVGLVFFVARLSIQARWWWAAIAAAALTVGLIATGGNLEALLPDAFIDRVDQVTGAVESDVASLQVRLQTYQHAINYIIGDPFVGVGMDAMNQGTLTPSLVVHNYILRGWYQGGVLLLIGFVLVTIALLALAVRGMRRTTLTAPSAIIASLLAFGMTSAFYTQSHYWLPILLSVAVISAALHDERTSTPVTASSP